MSAEDPLAPARARGWRLEGEPALLAALARDLLPDPHAALERGALLRRTAQRRVARLELAPAGAVLVKLEREAGPEDTLRRLFRPSRARAEWTFAHALRARGLPVPEPLALAERGGGLGARQTLYVARFLPGVEPLGVALGRLPAPGQQALLGRVGALVARLGEAGFEHQDLHPGNVLVGDGGRLWVIDLHRGAWRAAGAAPPLDPLARLLAGLESVVPDPAALRSALLAGWGRLEGAAQAALEARVARLRRAREAKQDAWALVDSPWYARLSAPLVGVRSVELAEEQVRARLVEHDAELSRGGEAVLKDRPKSAVTRHAGVVVKETRVRGWRGLLKRLLVPGRLVAGHVNAHRLRVRGIPTARSLALARQGPRRFTLYEDLSRLPRLDDLVRRLYAPGAGRAAQARLRSASAAWLAGLHARGVYHGDVKALHVLVEERPAGPVFVLIDTDRLKLLPRPVGRARRLKNLAQLDASIPVSVTRTERLRWWRAYAARLGAGDDERAMARRLARLLARKIRVVHAPLE